LRKGAINHNEIQEGDKIDVLLAQHIEEEAQILQGQQEELQQAMQAMQRVAVVKEHQVVKEQSHQVKQL